MADTPVPQQQQQVDPTMTASPQEVFIWMQQNEPEVLAEAVTQIVNSKQALRAAIQKKQPKPSAKKAVKKTSRTNGGKGRK